MIATWIIYEGSRYIAIIDNNMNKLLIINTVNLFP